jgi:hypothetical protein
MKVIHGADLWDYYYPDNWIVITTNTVIKKNGRAVMGAGIAKQAADRFPDLPYLYGRFLKTSADSSGIAVVPNIGLVLFPTKYHWQNPSDLDLIKKNAIQLANRYTEVITLGNVGQPIRHVFLPPLGCGLGKRKWEEVEPILSPILDDNFTVVFR